jgi:hypothetical protein
MRISMGDLKNKYQTNVESMLTLHTDLPVAHIHPHWC